MTEPSPDGSSGSPDDRQALNLINIDTEHPNDIISFAFLSEAIPSTSGTSCDAGVYMQSDNGMLDAPNIPTLPEGQSSYHICTRISDSAGNDAAYSDASLEIEFPINAPRLAAPTLDPENDTGVKGDNVTNLTTDITFRGTDAEEDASGVTITATRITGTADTRTATTTDITGGDYSVGLTLTEGVWDVVVRQTVDGFTSINSPSLELRVDTTPPEIVVTPPGFTLDAGATAIAINDITQLFSDSDPLTFAVTSPNTRVATVALVEGTNNLFVTGIIGTMVTIAITAEDPAGNLANLPFPVTVIPRGATACNTKSE